MAQFYAWLGARKSARIRLAVMDMWKPFRMATQAHAPQAAILFDKFHVMRHLGEALDTVRKSEYARLSGRDRRYIKGQKYTLLSRRENLTLDGKRALKTLLAANKRLNTAYLLKESFGQLWSYEREGWARRFFENWRASLKWQRLKPYEKFAAMIDRHWDGIAAYCRPENKVSLGFVEGLNNKIRVIQRRAYGLRDEDYLRLKILTCMLPHPVADSTPSRATSRIVPGAASTHAMRRRHSADRAGGTADIAVDMMDNASALPTCPQRQQQEKTAVRKWSKITHTTSRRGSLRNGPAHRQTRRRPGQ